jgi:hypothetical protein
MKFTYGKKQKVDSIDLDMLFTDLQAVLRKHPVVPAENIDTLISEWMNDVLFVTGKITDEELQEEAEELGEGNEEDKEAVEEESED